MGDPSRSGPQLPVPLCPQSLWEKNLGTGWLIIETCLHSGDRWSTSESPPLSSGIMLDPQRCACTEPGTISTAFLQVSDSKQLFLWTSFLSSLPPSPDHLSSSSQSPWALSSTECMPCSVALVQWDSVIPQTITHWRFLSTGFFWQEYWSGLPCPPSGNLPGSLIEPCLLRLLHCRWILYR